MITSGPQWQQKSEEKKCLPAHKTEEGCCNATSVVLMQQVSSKLAGEQQVVRKGV
jgi:hypothetical protein